MSILGQEDRVTKYIEGFQKLLMFSIYKTNYNLTYEYEFAYFSISRKVQNSI